MLLSRLSLFPRVAACASGLALASATPANAITFATGQGTDGAGCGAVTSPCRTLQQAVTNTPAGGYIVLQGPADFGPADIGKSISIVGENGATIKANAGAGGLRISASLNQFVRLRGLTIMSAGFGTIGVSATGAGNLEMANCIVRNFSEEGIFAAPFTSARSFVSIVDTTIENTSTGFIVRKASGLDVSVSAYLDGVQSRRNPYGFALLYEGGNAARAVVVNSRATDSSTAGFVGTQRSIPLPQLPPDAGLIVVRSVASGNGAGVISGRFGENDGLVALSRSVLTGNGSANGGSKLAFSYGGNVIRGNSNDTPGGFSSQPLH